MIHIYDCSNSVKRPTHRNGGGPKENDIIYYLKHEAHNYDCKFVESLSDADVILTNDVFDDESIASELPKVKRMDGIFCVKNLMERNDLLNEAAQQADHVIFITDYSKRCYEKLYGVPLKNCSVVRHWVSREDFHIFDEYPKYSIFTFCASATDWSRPEKRIGDLINFAEEFKEIDIQLIGKCELTLPSNIIRMGYFQYREVMRLSMNKCHAFLNLTYRDAATKTVCQAINCGLPVLYSNTGGVIEMVGDYGYAIPEENEIQIYEEIPEMSLDSLHKGYQQFMINYPKYLKQISDNPPYYKYDDMLEGYFNVIKNVITK